MHPEDLLQSMCGPVDGWWYLTRLTGHISLVASKIPAIGAPVMASVWSNMAIIAWKRSGLLVLALTVILSAVLAQKECNPGSWWVANEKPGSQRFPQTKSIQNGVFTKHWTIVLVDQCNNRRCSLKWKKKKKSVSKAGTLKTGESSKP